MYRLTIILGNMLGASFRPGLFPVYVYKNTKRWYTAIAYINAEDILPDELLCEIRTYIEGKAIYIPRSDKERKKWGASSGTREEYEKRNKGIVHEYENGALLAELAEKYCLCEDSIRKIIRKHRT